MLNPRLSDLADEIGVRCILEGPSFGDKYSTLYKYIRQCLWGSNWLAPDTFPFSKPDSLGGCSSWYQIRKLLITKGGDMTPEVLIPPECLFPWADDKPTKIKDRYAAKSDATPTKNIDMSLMKDIIKECLVPCRVKPTMTDFVASQCDTHRVATWDKLSDYTSRVSKETNEYQGPSATCFKYQKIPKWVDNQLPASGEYLFALRTPVWKRPTEYRDATTYSVTLLYQIWLLNQTLKYSWSDEISSSVGDFIDSEKLASWVSNNCLKDTYTINTDYKSSGLTMPHWFAEEVTEHLSMINGSDINIRFPSEGWPIFDKDSGEVYTSDTYGYGLGAVNNLYTLWNIVLHKYAIRKGIINDDSRILSFNDDSTFTSTEPVLGVWLRLIRDAGGWCDESKSVQLKGGTWFCEIHQMRSLQCNFKTVSAFHTLASTILKAVNKDHWRFLATDTFDAIRGWNHDVSKGGKDVSRNLITTIAQYSLNFAQSYWQTEFDLDCPIPECGGLSLDYSLRTPYALKGSLVWLERAFLQLDLDTWSKYARTFMLTKEYINRKIPYRPWKKFPEGRTRDIFITLGKMKGIHHELEHFGDKANNHFVTDSKWHRNEIWLGLTEELATKTPVPGNRSFWDWARKQDWPNEALPAEFVEEDMFLPENYVLPWVVNKKGKMASQTITSMVVDWSIGKSDELDFSPYFSHPTLVHANEVEYRPLLEPYELEKVLAHGEPKKVLLDYFLRYDRLPIKLRTEAKLCKTTLALLRKRYNFPFKPDGATWWTSMPIPFKNEWLDATKHLLPMHSEAALAQIYLKGVEYDTFENLSYSFVYLEEDKKYNKEFWKEQLKIKKKKEKSLPKTAGQMFSHVKASDRVYDSIDNIENDIVFDRVFLEKTRHLNLSYGPFRSDSVSDPLGGPERPAVKPEDWTSFARLDIPDWVNAEAPADNESDLAPEDAQQDYEDDLVDQYLNDGNWVADNEEDTDYG
jgi:hypothetical protein